MPAHGVGAKPAADPGPRSHRWYAALLCARQGRAVVHQPHGERGPSSTRWMVQRRYGYQRFCRASSFAAMRGAGRQRARQADSPSRVIRATTHPETRRPSCKRTSTRPSILPATPSARPARRRAHRPGNGRLARIGAAVPPSARTPALARSLAPDRPVGRCPQIWIFQTRRTGPGYCATSRSAVRRVMPSIIAWATRIRSKGSLWRGGSPTVATAC
jgi:hypothetical protein